MDGKGREREREREREFADLGIRRGKGIGHFLRVRKIYT